MSEVCVPIHDPWSAALTAFLCVGITASYLPQHWRIIAAKSSAGFSPWFLLLGSMSSASAMLNIIVMQWGIVRCCPVWSFGSCVESIAGVLQLILVWILFVMILVLYMVYYPENMKYVELDVDLPGNLPPRHIKTPVKQENWKLSVTLAWAVGIHIALIAFITFMLLSTDPTPDSTQRSPQIQLWATFLGLSSAVLATTQYTPQILHTFRLGLVGALSIPMMCLQTPGAILMVTSIVARPGTNWTTWISYAIAGVMQGILLVMCLVFRARQHADGIDDFGRPLNSPPAYADSDVDGDAVPASTPALEAAVGDAVHSDLRAEPEQTSEATPLLPKRDEGRRKGLFDWLKR
ncbi:uncharacterized protein BXZ73DRAFT_92674 [Epithele typhae]|uniref:uncharacterized protein n=1 Tax=Epithele typhae TaxID=378194 RepID=UPI002008A9BE|nr:uncharacterized protein BXZ73DRAFT_92674 [Epithele typhae]KAH9915172.1 hypothetical protein BXZ73DRAFT_92674 [Epithele typhae]